MKRIVKIVAVILIIYILLAPVFFIWGDPVTFTLTTVRTLFYLNKEYPGMGLRIDSITHDFKHGGYIVYVKSPTSIDTHFQLICNGWGEVKYDYYESSVLGLGNTAGRINAAYRELVDVYLETEDCPFDTGICIGEITQRFGNEVGSINKDFGMERSVLELDKEYDFREFGAKHGRITIYLYDEDVSVGRAAELLLELKAYLDKNDVPFYALEFNLFPPRNPDGTNNFDKVIHLIDFLYSDIYEEGLIERVQAARDEADIYYGLDE